MNLKSLLPLLALASGDFLNEPAPRARNYPLNPEEYLRGSDGAIRRTSPKPPSRRDRRRAMALRYGRRRQTDHRA